MSMLFKKKIWENPDYLERLLRKIEINLKFIFLLLNYIFI